MAIAARSRFIDRFKWARGGSSVAPNRRAMLVLGAMLLLALALTALAKAVPGIAPAVAGLRANSPSLMALIGERSPGHRTTAKLTKLKKKRAEAAAAKPKERALGKIFQPDRPALFKALTPESPLTSAQVAELSPLSGIGPGDIPALILPASSIPPVTVVPPSGGLGVVGGGGGGGGTTTTPTTEVPIVPPAVPEPDTWATMLLGFVLLAVATRRCRAVSGTVETY